MLKTMLLQQYCIWSTSQEEFHWPMKFASGMRQWNSGGIPPARLPSWKTKQHKLRERQRKHLHALIISLEPSGKIVKVQNDCTEFSHDEEFKSKISNSSFNFDLKTSCALPPYYSLELDPISSTSHSNLSWGPGSRFTWLAASAERKFIVKL